MGFSRAADFRLLQLAPEAVLRFQDLSLERVRFGGNDLRQVEIFHLIEAVKQSMTILLKQEEKENPWYLP
jgi:hypothetical protein